jgi:hypothetical protein
LDVAEYKKKFFTNPHPERRFAFRGIQGASIHYRDHSAALEFLQRVFGPPAYIEGEFTHGWKLGETWLSVFPSEVGNASNMEIPVYMESADDVDKLYQAFIEAGAAGEPPENTLMYESVRIAFVQDPFGVAWMLVAKTAKDK